ncbi:MAG: PilN domain-containing protein [Phycisphaerae bacterium]|nr:PilN domain-containing protein [Phycisphaerae bacterium]
MLQVNLLPAKYKRRAKRSRRIKLWLTLSVVVLCAEVLSALFLMPRAEQTREALDHAAWMQEKQPTLIKEHAALQAEKLEVARQLALSEQLRRKHRWSQVFSGLMRQLPEKILLTGLKSDPPRDQTIAAKTAAGAGLTPWGKREAAETTPDKSSTASGLVITGLAVDYEAVAALLGGLSDRSGLGTCELESTARQPFMNGEAVTFSIRMRW